MTMCRYQHCFHSRRNNRTIIIFHLIITQT
nr:MAG TPA: hypothetical protein [Caudoviricetes sp.]